MYILLDPNGRVVCEAETGAELAQKIIGHPAYRMICFQTEVSVDGALKPGEVKKKLQELKFFNSDGSAHGVTNILPKGAWLEHSIQFQNQAVLNGLSAVEVDFPILYSTKDPAIQELTKHYEEHHEVFHIDRDTALSYAADPNLFLWLKNKVLDSHELPVIFNSPIHFMRNFSPNGAHRRREFTMPDLHTLSDDETKTTESYLNFITVGSTSMRQLFTESWLQFCDIENEFYAAHPELPSEMAKAANQFTLVKILEKRPRYYAMRSGLVTDAGYDNVMVYNLQWDDTNAKLFNITTTKDRNPIIIHATLAGGCARVLPALVGQLLAKVRPSGFPCFLLTEHIVLLAITQESMTLCQRTQEKLLESGIRAKIILVDRGLNAEIKSIRNEWTPYYAVVGNQETSGANPIIVQSSFNEEKLELNAWEAAHRELIKKYTPPHIAPTRKEIPIVPSYLVKARKAEWRQTQANLFQPPTNTPVEQNVVGLAASTLAATT